MSWDTRRKSNRKYYCRSVRIGRKTTKCYVGLASDPVVQFIANGDALCRAESASVVGKVRTEQDHYKELESLLKALPRRIQELQELKVLSVGYRRRKGEWQAVVYRNTEPDCNGQHFGDEPPTRELFEHLATRANRGDRHAADQLREILRRHPEIWEPIGNLTDHVERSLIELIADGNLVFAESMRRQVEQWRQDLLDEASDQTLERLLIDHVILSRLDLECTRMAAIQRQNHKRDSRYWDQRCQRASARYTAAIKELATIRELIGDAEGAERTSLAIHDGTA